MLRGGTWYNTIGMEAKNLLYQVSTSLYFSLTTLSTVGYGDFFPISAIEMILGVITMLLGVFFFSYIMGQLQSILEANKSKVGFIDKTDDMNDWLF